MEGSAEEGIPRDGSSSRRDAAKYMLQEKIEAAPKLNGESKNRGFAER